MMNMATMWGGTASLNVMADSDEEMGRAMAKRFETSTLAIRCSHCGDLPVTEPMDLVTLSAITPGAGVQCFECSEEARVLLGGLEVGGTRGALDAVRSEARRLLKEKGL